ncbi:MAG: hypothetical protein ACI392_08790 [Paludibacteraceae bacterium]
MTREEYVAICRNCKLRKFDAHKGIVCSLTGEHASFADECENYKEDEKELARIELKETEYQGSLGISGWLAFFLWVGVGGGAFASVIFTLITAFSSGFSVEYTLLSLAGTACLVMVAVKTIFAFYKRKENAVSLAFTYISMIAIDGVMALVISIISDEYSDLVTTFRQFVWAGIWGIYLYNSSQVEELIPKAKRIWKKFEKCVLGLFIVFEFLIIVVACFAPTFVLSDAKLIDNIVVNMNYSIQSDPSSDIKGVRIEGKNLIFRMCIRDVLKVDCDEQALSEQSVVVKYHILSATAIEHDASEYEELKIFFKNHYNLYYEFVDKNNFLLYSVIISPSEYEEAYMAGSSFKCPDAVIDSLIGIYTEYLPTEFVGGCQLENIVCDYNRNELIYTMRLPEMDNYTLLMDVDATYLSNYVHENWEYYEDNIVSLAKINKLTICERFLTHDGYEHAVVRISADEYQN